MKTDLRGMKQLVNSINQLRDETNHRKKIERPSWETAKWIWSHSKNSKEFKAWMKVELGW